MQSNKFLNAFIYGAILLTLVAGSSLLLAQQDREYGALRGFERFRERSELRERVEERQAEIEAYLQENPEAAALMDERRELQERHRAELEAWHGKLQAYIDAHPEAGELFTLPRGMGHQEEPGAGFFRNRR